jgi:hypothetical protein
MHHICAPKRLLTGLLAFVVAAMLVQSAAASSPRVIPYLSHGVGVDQSLYSGQSHALRRTAATPATHKAVPDAFERMVARQEATTGVTAVRPDDRAGIRGIDTRTYQPSTAVRPDDRSGLRGIGGSVTTTASVSTSSSSSVSDLDKALIGTGGFLAVLLVAAGVVALGRRQPKRLATH